MVTGRMFIPSCLFGKGAPNHVHIKLKRSPSNLTLLRFGLNGECEFDLYQCQRCRNRGMLHIIRLALMGQRCYYTILCFKYVLWIKRGLRKTKHSPFLLKRQSAPSVLSKLSRADNASDPIKNPAHQPVFLLQEGILLTGTLDGLPFE